MPALRVLSHESAASAYGLPRLDDARHLTTEAKGGVSTAEVVLHRAALCPSDIRTVRAELVTTPLRTIVDLSRCRPLPYVVAVADAALRLRLVTAAQLRAAAQDIRGPGTATLRRAVAFADGRSGSMFESLVRVALLGARLGPVALQVQFDDNGHPYDLALPWAKVLVECDGWDHHSSRTAFKADRHFGNEVVARLGWQLVRLVWSEAWPDPASAVAAVQAAVAASVGPRARQRRYRTDKNPGS